MNASIIVATIALVAAVASAAISLLGSAHLARTAARRDAAATLAKYREPLLYAANELQSRLWNTLKQSFLASYFSSGNPTEREYTVQNTVYLVAQYFGWTEILRREVQFLSFSTIERTRESAKLLDKVRLCFSSDRPDLGGPFRIWRGDQGAIGELMVLEVNGRLSCLGYAGFVACREPGFRRWFQQLEQDVAEVARQPNVRLILLQNALVDLIKELDQPREEAGWLSPMRRRSREDFATGVRFRDEHLQKVPVPAWVKTLDPSS